MANDSTSATSSLALQPGVPVALTNLGFCLQDLGRPAEAVRYFEEALASDPNYHDARFGLASAVEAQGQSEKAVRLWREYLELAPESRWRETARKNLEQLTGQRDSRP